MDKRFSNRFEKRRVLSIDLPDYYNDEIDDYDNYGRESKLDNCLFRIPFHDDIVFPNESRDF